MSRARATVAFTLLTATLAAFVAALAAPGASSAPATPAASSSPAAPGAPAASGIPTPARVPVLYQIRDGAQVDLGWTGISHDQPWPGGQRLGFELACTAGEPACSVSGGEPEAPFGAPVALSSGGIPVCVVNKLRVPLTGSVNTESGCGEIRFALTTAVFMGAEVARPCPVCSGDKAPHDGRKDGKCDGGATPDAPCDAESGSGRFGATSNDCLPQGTSIGRLPDRPPAAHDRHGAHRGAGAMQAAASWNAGCVFLRRPADTERL